MGKKHKSDWTWVGELNDASQITDDHRLRAAGLKDITPCPYTFAVDSTNDDEDHKRAREIRKANGCTKGGCGRKSGCVNYLGQPVSVDKEAKDKFVDAKLSTLQLRGNAPAGLRNLGATCYANAFLQLWYYNVAFRNAIYACEATEGSPLFHLAHIFASLQHTRRRFVDPTPLIEALRLDKADQQDAGEFSKLFLDLIAGELSKQRDEKLRMLTQDLFQGHKEITITCECGYKSARQEAFLELEIPLKDGKSLLDRLNHSLAEEEMYGDNQYNCPACGRKRDATRSTRLLDLPPVLHFTLLRFVYDLKRYERKKTKAKISYPKELKFGDYHYRLQAVVVHYGASAHQGHFVCEALDEQVGGWWECNDEDVTRISRLVRSGSSENGHTPKKPRLEHAEITSKDAYMLVYTRSNAIPAASPSATVMRKVEQDYLALEVELGERHRMKEIVGDEWDMFIPAKRQVARILQGRDRLLPTAQLKKWFAAETVEEMFGPWSIPTCLHGGIDPTTVEDFKLVSQAAFDLLSDYCTEDKQDEHSKESSRSRSASSPGATTIAYTRLPALIICPTCVSEAYQEQSVQRIVLSKEEKDAWKAEIRGEYLLKQNHLDPPYPVYDDRHYYLPKSFVSKWKHYLSKPFQEKPELPADLGRCRHGKLPVDLDTDGTHFITKTGWAQLTKIYGQAMPITFHFIKQRGIRAAPEIGPASVETCVPCRREKLLQFDKTNIHVRVERLTENGTRRARKKPEPFPVEKSTTMLHIKSQVYQDLHISPIFQQLWYNGRELDNEETIESAEVLAFDTIVCKELEAKEDVEDDHTSIEGFVGTALTGRLSCPVCTFDNDADSVCCKMCERPFGFD